MIKNIPPIVQEQIVAITAYAAREKLEAEERYTQEVRRREFFYYVFCLVRNSGHPEIACNEECLSQFSIYVNGRSSASVRFSSTTGKVMVSALTGPEYLVSAEMTDAQIWEVIALAMKDSIEKYKAKEKPKPWWKFWE